MKRKAKNARRERLAELNVLIGYLITLHKLVDDLLLRYRGQYSDLLFQAPKGARRRG